MTKTYMTNQAPEVTHDIMCDVLRLPKEINCGTCHACCIGQSVHLLPDSGDIPENYETKIGNDGFISLALNEDENCIYLKDNKCSIYATRPYICQHFDCRTWFRVMPPEQVRVHFQSAFMDEKVYEAGFSRMQVLDKAGLL